MKIPFGVILFLLSLWGGSWLMHVVPDYMGFAAYVTAFSGVALGGALAIIGAQEIMK